MKEPGHPETAPLGFLIKSQGSAPSRPLCLCPVPGRGVRLMLHNVRSSHHTEQALSCARKLWNEAGGGWQEQWASEHSVLHSRSARLSKMMRFWETGKGSCPLV